MKYLRFKEIALVSETFGERKYDANLFAYECPMVGKCRHTCDLEKVLENPISIHREPCNSVVAAGCVYYEKCNYPRILATSLVQSGEVNEVF